MALVHLRKFVDVVLAFLPVGVGVVSLPVLVDGNVDVCPLGSLNINRVPVRAVVTPVVSVLSKEGAAEALTPCILTWVYLLSSLSTRAQVGVQRI